MAFRIARGTNRWNKQFRTGLGFEQVLEMEAVDIPNSTVNGQHDASVKSELSYMELKQRRDLRMQPRKRAFIDDLDEVIDQQDVRLYDPDVGGTGGQNAEPEKVKQDKPLMKEVKEENKHDDAFANEFNPDVAGAGAFTGGVEREKILKKNKIDLQ